MKYSKDFRAKVVAKLMGSDGKRKATVAFLAKKFEVAPITLRRWKQKAVEDEALIAELAVDTEAEGVDDTHIQPITTKCPIVQARAGVQNSGKAIIRYIRHTATIADVESAVDALNHVVFLYELHMESMVNDGIVRTVKATQ